MRSLFWAMLVLLAACGGPEPNVKSQDPYERFLGELELQENNDAASMAELLVLLDDPHFLVVAGAIEVLAHQKRPEFLQHLLPKLKHKHPLVRQTACAGIAEIHNPEGVPGLVECLKDPDPGVRRSALKAVAAFPEVPETTTAMIDAVDDKDVSVSYMAARLLHQRTGKDGIKRTKKDWAEALK